MLSPLTLREREFAPYAWTDADLKALARLEPRGALSAEARGLRAGGLVGFVRLPSGTVQVLPKAGSVDPGLAAANVLTLLARVGDLPRSPRADELQVVRGDWIEAIIGMFARSLAGALARGPILRSARVYDDTSPNLRGRLRLSVAAARPARAHQFPIEFVERRADSPSMRALLWAVKRLAPLSRSAAHRILLSRLEMDLATVPMVVVDPPLSWFEGQELSRHETYFVAPLAFAALLRSGLTTAFAPGGTSAAAFWVDMDRLFERLAVCLARRIVPDDWQVAAQEDKVHLGTMYGVPEMRLRPDLVLREHGRVRLVLDTKHKLWNGRPSESDAYALVAYLRRYEVSKGVLLYPRLPDRTPRHWRLQLHSGGAIEAKFLDLTSDLSQVGAWDRMEAQMREALGVE